MSTSNNAFLVTNTVKGDDLLMQGFATKVNNGGTLTQTEVGIAVTAAAARGAERFGPTPATFQLKPLPLPESVKGILAEYST